MKNMRRKICLILSVLFCAALLPAFDAAAEGFELGNTDLNILNGGIMLSSDGELYFNNNGIFVQHADETVEALSADNGKNLNLYDDMLYYTLGREVKSVPKDGGAAKTVFKAAGIIKQMYAVNGSFYYISSETAYSCKNGAVTRLCGLSGVLGLIPTQYGNIFLTGEVNNYTLWAGETQLLTGVTSCYTDSGYLVLYYNGENYMVELSRVFSGFYASRDLQDFNLHGTVSLAALFDEDADSNVSEYNENYDLVCDYDALLSEAGLKSTASAAYCATTYSADVSLMSAELSEGQQNIVKRAKQLTGFTWTPLENIVQWGNRGTFYAETTYTGVPYGQPVNTNGYIGYGISIDGFAAAILDNTSKLYTSTSTYNKVAPYYSTDCSGFVSYCWGISPRKTTVTIPNVAEKVGDQSIYSLQVGDCLDLTTSHVVLITDLAYDANGNIVWLEVSEQTPVLTCITHYGQGETRSLASFQSYYLERGYAIYRNPARDSVTYTACQSVQLEGETASNAAAPKSKTTAYVGYKTVELTTDIPDAVIYYTTDGTTPTANSSQYTGALTFSAAATKLYAVAVSPSYSGSTVLKYTVKVPQAATPTASLASGMSEGGLVSSGSTIKLASVSGSTIYYTTDGSAPTTSSKAYSSPITVTSDTTIKAMAQAKGYTQSETLTVSYKIGQVFTITACASAGGSISPSGSTSVFQSGSKTYTITPNNGYSITNVLVDGVNVGAVQSYTFSGVSANHKISASFAVGLPFTDVPAAMWYYDAVCFAYTNSLFKGMTDTTFGPDETMTRGMFITVLGRFAGLSENLSGSVGLVTATGVNIRKGPSTETDVVGFISNKRTVVSVVGQEGDWYQVKYGTVTGYIRNDLIAVYNDNYTDLNKDMYYSVYVQWACVSGIANGVASTVFNADVPITREDMCIIMYNYAQVYGKTLPTAESKTVFSDDSSISSGAKTAVYALQQADIINGMGDGTFEPSGTAKRSQVAQIYKNFVTALS